MVILGHTSHTSCCPSSHLEKPLPYEEASPSADMNLATIVYGYYVAPRGHDKGMGVVYGKRSAP